MTDYKVIVRNTPNWRSHKSATLGVSILSPNWQGDKLAAILKFAAAHFNEIRIDVTDALYRHSFMAEGMTSAEAMAHANSLGALWLAENADVLHTMKVQPNIIRWAEWYKHASYEAVKSNFHKAYEIDPVLAQAVNQDILEFYARKSAEPNRTQYQASKNYLLEELAVITLQGREMESLKIYPGDELKCLNVVRLGKVASAPWGLERETYGKIKFEARPERRKISGHDFLIGSRQSNPN